MPLIQRHVLSVVQVSRPPAGNIYRSIGMYSCLVNESNILCYVFFLPMADFRKFAMFHPNNFFMW
jgi:hypothetical protein